MTISEISNIFTVDVEDYFQVSAFENDVRRDQWDRWESRVEANTHRVLRLLDRHRVRATFFILGWTAERYPGLVRKIHAAGHEIGCHGYWHRLIYRQTPEAFRADLRQSRDVIQSSIGQAVTAYRAQRQPFVFYIVSVAEGMCRVGQVLAVPPKAGKNSWWDRDLLVPPYFPQQKLHTSLGARSRTAPHPVGVAAFPLSPLCRAVRERGETGRFVGIFPIWTIVRCRQLVRLSH